MKKPDQTQPKIDKSFLPIVMGIYEKCQGKCSGHSDPETPHHVVIYEDAEYHTCLVCKHRFIVEIEK